MWSRNPTLRHRSGKSHNLKRYMHPSINHSTIYNCQVPFVAMWMDLEILVLSEVRQRKLNIIWYCLHVESKTRLKWTYLQSRKRVTDAENKLMVTRGYGGGGYTGRLGLKYTYHYIKPIIGPIVHHREFYSILCFAIHLKLTQHCKSTIPQ